MKRPIPLLTIRTALVLFIAVFIGIVTAAITQLSGQAPAAVVLAGVAACGASLVALDMLVGSDRAAGGRGGGKRGKRPGVKGRNLTGGGHQN
jgi:hypothetical protein